MMKPSLRYAISCAAFLALSNLLAQAAPPRIADCQIFPNDNVWNTRVDTLKVHSQSGTWVNTIGLNANLHPDFGTFYLGAPIGIPFIAVPAGQTPVAVMFAEPDESDPGPYPIPPDAPIEGGAGSTGDRHVLVIKRDACVLYETSNSYLQPDGSWAAFSGAVFNLGSNAMRPSTWTSADAAGLPILAGLVRRDEVLAGEINHALRFTAPQTRNQFIWPARHQASELTGTQYPPMGARFRLKAGFNISTFSPQNQVVLRALKKYGMILADNGSSWYVSGEHNPAWDDDLLGQLKTLKGSDFEAVDSTPLIADPNSAQAFQPPPPVTLREVATGLTNPVELAHAGDASGRLFIVQKAGLIRILSGGTVLPTSFLNVSTLISTSSERGLLGLAFDPQFRTNRRFYVLYTRSSDGALVLATYLVNVGNPNVADISTAQILTTVAHPGADNHNGGKIAFGPDGYLYLAVGDGGGSGDTANNAQNLATQLGKILRFDVTSTPGSALIPPSNPFVGVAGAHPSIWAYGVRNPWKFSFDRQTGDLYIADVGQNTTEEVNFQPAGSPGGQNYGWRVFEGNGCHNPSSGCSLAGHTPPVLQYNHNASGGDSITGGYVYRGTRSASLRGFYIYGDFISNRVWAARRVGSQWSNFVLIEPPSLLSGVSTFGEDGAGELYIANYNNGRLYAIDGEGPRFEGANDFNADGRPDLIWSNTGNGATYIWRMNGTTLLSDSLLATIDPIWKVQGVGDFNGDGHPDVVWRHTGNGNTYVWYLINGVLQSDALLFNLPPEWVIQGVADFNADGKPDFLMRNANSGNAFAWFFNNNVAIGDQFLFNIDPVWKVEGVGDFNADGQPDLLFRNMSSGLAFAWNTQYAAGSLSLTTSSQSIFSIDTAWEVVQVADWNADGKPDLVFRNTGSGLVFVWYMDGTTLTTSDFINQIDPAWEIVPRR